LSLEYSSDFDNELNRALFLDEKRYSKTQIFFIHGEFWEKQYFQIVFAKSIWKVLNDKFQCMNACTNYITLQYDDEHE